MNNSIIDFALSDFNIDPIIYSKLKHDDLLKITENYINLDTMQQNCLQMSQQILLNNKKKVAFDLNDSPEYTEIIKKETEIYAKQKKHVEQQYNIPVCEYIDVCMSNASIKKKREKRKEKINYKNN
jgi:hypothetical protein